MGWGDDMLQLYNMLWYVWVSLSELRETVFMQGAPHDGVTGATSEEGTHMDIGWLYPEPPEEHAMFLSVCLQVPVLLSGSTLVLDLFNK